jgi:hypothetical protein
LTKIWNTGYSFTIHKIIRREINEEENCMAGGELLDGGGPGVSKVNNL